MAYANGRLPKSELAKIPDGELRKDAAAAWNAMWIEAKYRYGVDIRPTGPMSSYRTYDEQVYLKRLELAGKGNPAATPGTSNHGEGIAVDLKTEQMRKIIDKLGTKYGWAKKWSDAPDEWWHIKWKPGIWSMKTDRLKPLSKKERKWLYTYFRLKAQNKNILRRKALRALLRRQAKAVKKKMDNGSISSATRQRYKILNHYS